ncbi:MAG: 4-(cytidine 5'-diphospho)-2-C-methyl-D-erythritol kinase [Pseudoflavonifractor sp.]|nr:4-(cytidine 5'-diphospho)-2-C-methyl-D-erythritol kinase [Pseudoflavonifractor sp.]
MILYPNAKINLGLDIIRKRPDGYHDIETVMYPIPWRDILEIVPAKGESTTLTVSGREVACPPDRNLVMRAYHLLSSHMPLPPVDIYLHKIIPDGAGLGGGSADASFTLLGLNEIFSLGLSKQELAGIASSIGADCPFFIYNTPMLATGTGTTLSPVDISLKGKWIAVVKPPVSVPTAQAYTGVSPHLPERPMESIISQDISLWGTLLNNDFEPGIFAKHPAVAGIKSLLLDLGAVYASMSGSGSAVYGIFNDDNLSEEIKSCFDDCDVFFGAL